jgi:condensin complex subunit 3
MQKNIYQDRILRFMGTFASETKSQGQLDLIEALLQQIVELSFAKDPTARWRSCQLVHCIMSALPAEAAISDDAADLVQEAMLQRLDDAKPNVRAAAVRALARLPIPDDDGDFRDCPVTVAFLELLASEKSKDVRKAVLASLPAAPCTQAPIMDRTKDESDDVRRITYLAIAEKVRLEALGAAGGALLVSRGLGDRASTVSEAAGAMVTAWLDNVCDGEPLALLRWLDPAAHPEESELALKSLIESGRLNAVQVGKLASEENLGLRADFFVGEAPLMGSEEAIFWKVVCERLASEATSKGLAAANTGGATANIEAAAAGDRIEALEAALPASVEDMINIISAHVAGGAEYRFASAQLMSLAAHCMDFTDSTGRRAASNLLHKLFSSGWEECGSGENGKAWMEAAGKLARKVHAAPAELADAMLTSLGALRDNSNGFNGSGSSSDADAAWIHALRSTALLLEALPTARPALQAAAEFTLTDMVNEIINPGLEHANANVRCEAVRCLGLYCLLDGIPTPLGSHMPTLRSCLASSSQPLAVRAVAARAVGDLALQRGARSLDTLLVAQAAEDPVVGTEPTIDLMLTALNEWQDAFAVATSAPNGRRRRSAPSPQEVESVAELGTCLVEALVRLIAVNEFRQASDERRGEVSALEDGEVLRLLVALLLLHFDADTEPASRLRQCLSVFFERFASLSVTSQQYLATAVLPAARSACAEDLAAGRRTATSSPVAPQVVRFVLQLLQLPVIGMDGKREPLGHEPLTELVLGEILGCARRPNVPKPYLSALCKLPLALPMYDAGEDTRETMLRIQVYAAKAAEILSDKIMVKDMTSTVERYAAPLGASPELSEEGVAALLAGVKAHVEAFCSGFPMPFDEEGDEEEERRPAARGSRRRAPVTVTADSSDEEESDDEIIIKPRGAAAATKRAPTRGARSTKNLAETESDDEGPVLEMPPADNSSDDEGSETEIDEDDSEQPENDEENAEAARVSARKARRASVASVTALREALKENARIS